MEPLKKKKKINYLGFKFQLQSMHSQILIVLQTRSERHEWKAVSRRFYAHALTSTRNSREWNLPLMFLCPLRMVHSTSTNWFLLLLSITIFNLTKPCLSISSDCFFIFNLALFCDLILREKMGGSDVSRSEEKSGEGFVKFFKNNAINPGFAVWINQTIQEPLKVKLSSTSHRIL